LGVNFEFDEKKSRANKTKHGIDFLEAQALWMDIRRIEVPARTKDEPRYMLIGLIDDRTWSAVITYRDGKVRIISARPSREEEVGIYEG